MFKYIIGCLNAYYLINEHQCSCTMLQTKWNPIQQH